jgi:hypothetical protein
MHEENVSSNKTTDEGMVLIVAMKDNKGGAHREDGK